MTQHKNNSKLFRFEEEEMHFSLFRFLKAKGLLMIPKLKILYFSSDDLFESRKGLKILLFQLSLKPCPSYIAEILLKYLVLGFRISNEIELQIEFLVKDICRHCDLDCFIFLNNISMFSPGRTIGPGHFRPVTVEKLFSGSAMF